MLQAQVPGSSWALTATEEPTQRQTHLPLALAAGVGLRLSHAVPSPTQTFVARLGRQAAWKLPGLCQPVPTRSQLLSETTGPASGAERCRGCLQKGLWDAVLPQLCAGTMGCFTSHLQAEAVPSRTSVRGWGAGHPQLPQGPAPVPGEQTGWNGERSLQHRSGVLGELEVGSQCPAQGPSSPSES